MNFIYGLNCVALFLGYCVLICAAILFIALIVSMVRNSGKDD